MLVIKVKIDSRYQPLSYQLYFYFHRVFLYNRAFFTLDYRYLYMHAPFLEEMWK